MTRHVDELVSVQAKARYETAASTAEATNFYQLQLAGASSNVTTVIGAPDGADAHFDAATDPGRYSARVFELGWVRTVMVHAESTQLDEHVSLAELANWHGLDIFEGAIIDRAEAFTVASGVCAPVQAIYSTEYRLPGFSRGDLRSMTEALLQDQGWSPTETFEDSLLFTGPSRGEGSGPSGGEGSGPFSGEAHIVGTAGEARLTLVGEFLLTDDPTLN